MIALNKIPLIITIDTEGDNLWSKPQIIETKNTEGLYRFQELCNRYDFKPVYLTNYEMAMDDKFVEFGKFYAGRGQCEIGMHLHAWNSPPEYNLTQDDYSFQPFLCEYPVEVIDKKVRYMTELLRDRFSMEIVSHRAGRWAMSDDYFRVLKENGYLIDCSVTPGVDWSRTMGDPNGHGGSNYYKASHKVYWSGEKENSVLEVPMTIEAVPRVAPCALFNPVKYKLPSSIYRVLYKKSWFRPSGNNLEEMKKLADENRRNGADHLEFMIHSSELSAGLNPNFVGEAEINNLYDQIGKLFEYICSFAEGYTLQEFYRYYREYRK